MLLAIELAHDIGADGPRCNLHSLRLLAFAVRLLIGRADERALDEKAIEAVNQWKFEPAQKDGRPVAVAINVEVQFRLY